MTAQLTFESRIVYVNVNEIAFTLKAVYSAYWNPKTPRSLKIGLLSACSLSIVFLTFDL